MMKGFLACLLLVASSTALPTQTDQQNEYFGHSVIRVVPENESQLKYLRLLFEESGLDFWLEPSDIGRPVDIRMSPLARTTYVDTLASIGMEVNTFIQDVGELIAEQAQSDPRPPKKAGELRWSDWSQYEELEDIEGWLVQTQAENSDFVSLTSLGQSYEGRDIWLLRINKDPEAADKVTVFIDCNIHAREWVTSAVCTWMINEFLTNPEYADDLPAWDIHIIPVFNVDGFAYSHDDESNRLWRKTRTDYESIFGCKGADPNRNWDSNFGGPGTSADKCNDIFHGPEPFSEPITQIVSDYIMQNGGAIKFYMTIHSYSQYIMTPWGYKTSLPDDYDDIIEAGSAGEAALEAVYGTQYTSGSVANVIHVASGGSLDWTYDTVGIKYSYAMELRDKGQYGFLLPAEQIIPCAEETMEGLAKMLETARAIGF